MVDRLESTGSEPDRTTEITPAGPPDCGLSSDTATLTALGLVIEVLEKAALEETVSEEVVPRGSVMEEVVLEEATIVLRADGETALGGRLSEPDALVDDDNDADDGLVYVTMRLAEAGRLVELMTDEK